MLLWLWCRLATAVWFALLAWEPPYAAGAALKKANTPPKKNKKNPTFGEGGEGHVVVSKNENMLQILDYFPVETSTYLR